MKHTIFSLGQIAINNPQTIAVSAVIAAIFQIYMVYMGLLVILIIGDCILGALAAKKNEFNIEILFKKTGIKVVTYAVGIASFLIITYFPFDGTTNETLAWGHRALVLWLAVNEYLSIARNGAKLGIRLAPQVLLKQLKAAQKAAGTSKS